MSCQAAGPLGARAADTVLSRIAGETPAPVALGFVGQCISLGRGSAIFQLARHDDTAIRFHLGGRPGATLKRLVCWATIKQPATEARKPGSFSMPGWLTDGNRQEVLRVKRSDPMVSDNQSLVSQERPRAVTAAWIPWIAAEQRTRSERQSRPPSGQAHEHAGAENSTTLENSSIRPGVGRAHSTEQRAYSLRCTGHSVNTTASTESPVSYPTRRGQVISREPTNGLTSTRIASPTGVSHG